MLVPKKTFPLQQWEGLAMQLVHHQSANGSDTWKYPLLLVRGIMEQLELVPDFRKRAVRCENIKIGVVAAETK